MDDDSNQSRSRNVISLLVAQFLLAIAGALIGSILQIFAFELGATFLLLGLMTVVQRSITAVLAPFWGKVSDKAQARKPFVIFSLFLGSFVTLGYLFIKNIYELLALLTLGSFIGVIGGPALSAVTSTIGGYKKRSRFIGLFVSFSSLGWTIGSFLAVLIISSLGVNELFLLSFGLQILAAIILALGYKEIRNEIRIKKAVMDSIHEIEDKWKHIIANLRIRTMVSLRARKRASNLTINDLFIIILITSFSSSAFFLVFSIKLYLVLKRNITTYVLLNAISALLSTLAPPIYGWIADRIGRKTVFAVFLLVRFVYMFLLAFLWDPLILSILWILPIWVGLHVSLKGLIVDIVGEKYAASGQSLISTADSIGVILGNLIGGLIADYLGCHANIHNATILLLVTPAPFLFSSIRIFKLRLCRKY